MDLRDEHISSQVVEALLMSPSATKLDLSENPELTDTAARALLPALASAEWICEVELRGCRQVSAAALGEVSDACLSNRLPALLLPVSENKGFKRALGLFEFGLRDKHMALLADSLSGNGNLQKIDLSGNPELTDDGVMMSLVPALGKCRVAEVLVAGCDGLSDAARVELKDACLPNALGAILAPVRVNDKKVMELGLSQMDLWDEALGLVAEALSGNEHVTKVDLCGNSDLTANGVRLLLPAIARSCVGEVDLFGCPGVSRSAKDELWAACLPNLLAGVRANDPAVTEINLFSVGLRDEQIDLLAAALSSSGLPAPEGEEDDRPETAHTGQSGPSSRPGTSQSGSQWLRRTGNLHVLRVDLRKNRALTDSGVRLLLPAIANSRVTAVDLSDCPGVTATAKRQVCRACLKNALAPLHANEPFVIALSLRDYMLRDDELEAVANALTDNKHCLRVDLSRNGELTAAGVSTQGMPQLLVISSSYTSNPSDVCDLSAFSDRSRLLLQCKKLAKAVRVQKLVREVVVAGCFGLSDAARKELAGACSDNLRAWELLT